MSLSVTIKRIVDEATGIRSFELIGENGKKLPPYSAGAHVQVMLGNDLIRQYSLINDSNEDDIYRIAVLKDASSRGGSEWIHENWKEGHQLEISEPINQFELDNNATRHILIAGGIGITPILCMTKTLHRDNVPFEMYYSTRSKETTAFHAEITDAPYNDQVTIIHDEGDPSKGLNLKELLANQLPGDHVYFCGPQGLIKAIQDAASHWTKGTVHFELFAADDNIEIHQDADQEFTVQLQGTGKEYSIPAGKSILHVLEEDGVVVPKLCEEGFCGSCLTPVIEGIPDHRDAIQTDAERESNEFITVCCSRSKSKRLVLDI